MKLPMTPPEPDDISSFIKSSEKTAILMSTSPEYEGRYYHWDRLRYKTPPEGLSHKEWWSAIKYSRRVASTVTPFLDNDDKPFWFTPTSALNRYLHTLDQKGGDSLFASITRTNLETSRLILQSFENESITSSQLEGASTNIKTAKEMLRKKLKPKDLHEQMIFNNYRAMQFLKKIRTKKLTLGLILEIHEIITTDTLENSNDSGKLRDRDDIHVSDGQNETTFYTPPKAEQLQERMELLCQIANENEEKSELFIHPILRAIMLHFMLSYNHPFVDGNGRTARALFYWYLLGRNYCLLEYISISEVIKNAPSQYARSFLYCETDESDMTYFLLAQLEVMSKAIELLHTRLKARQDKVSEVTAMAVKQFERGAINLRQLELLRHALDHPGHVYDIEQHSNVNQISYGTARSDLLLLSDKLGILERRKRGRAFIFISPADIEKRVTGK